MSGKKASERVEYKIRVSGIVVSVSKEVYGCWYSTHRQERYQKERDQKHGVVSLEELPKYVYVDGKDGEKNLIAQDNVLEEAIHNLMVERLRKEISDLQEENRRLVQALYFDNVGICEYAKENGVTYKAIQKRRDRILKKLKKILENI